MPVPECAEFTGENSSEMLRRKHNGATDERRRILFIGSESSVSHAVNDFLPIMDCGCTITSGKDALAAIERDVYDAVVLDLGRSHEPGERIVQAIREIRPALAERILLIHGSGEIAPLALKHLPGISEEQPLLQLWARLKEIFSARPAHSFVPPGAEVPQLIFDSFNSPMVAGIRGLPGPTRQLAYQRDSSTINLLIRPMEDGVRISVLGQVLDVSMRDVHGLPVQLHGQAGSLAQTTTNQFGEFGLQFAFVENAGLQIRLAEGSWIHMLLENMDWIRNPITGLNAGN